MDSLESQLSEAEELFHNFIKANRFKDRHAFIQYTNSLRLMHLEDNCPKCATQNADDIKASGCLRMEPCDEVSKPSINNPRKSERKSRKSVCVQKLNYSFSESDDEENEVKDKEKDESADGSEYDSANDELDDDQDDADEDQDYQHDKSKDIVEASDDDEVFISRNVEHDKIEIENEEKDELDVSPDASPVVTKKKKNIRAISSGSDSSVGRSRDSDSGSEGSVAENSLNLSSGAESLNVAEEVPAKKEVRVVLSSSEDDDSSSDSPEKHSQPKSSKIRSINISSGDDSDDFATPLHSKTKNLKTPKIGLCTPTFKTPKSVFKTPRSSLANVLHKFPQVEPRTPKYKHHFNKQRDQLIKELFTLYNRTVFDKKLPDDFQVSWNKRMTKTAGFCYLKTTVTGRVSHVELSTKVVDTVERLRDTLIHELCHAATWIFEGKRGHGLAWKYWAKKANKVHPELPIIETCHAYNIETKFKYQCDGCGEIFGRHSKSIDATKHACAKCGGRPLLISASGSSISDTPRKVNAYSEYVKNHYSRIKCENPDSSPKDIMKLVAEDFRAFKISQSDEKENVPCS